MKKLLFILLIFSACKTNHTVYTFHDDKSGGIGSSNAHLGTNNSFIYDTIGVAQWLGIGQGVLYGRNDTCFTIDDVGKTFIVDWGCQSDDLITTINSVMNSDTKTVTRVEWLNKEYYPYHPKTIGADIKNDTIQRIFNIRLVDMRCDTCDNSKAIRDALTSASNYGSAQLIQTIIWTK